MAYNINEEKSDVRFVVDGDDVAIKLSESASGGSGNSPYIIKEEDTTSFADENVLSSKRTVKEITSRSISKVGDDSVQGHITFNGGLTASDAEIEETNTKDLSVDNEALLKKGFKTDDFVSGVSGGLFGVDSDGKIYLEVDKILVRIKAYFESLEIKKVSYIAGEEIISPAGGITCIQVEELTDVYRCHFCADDGDIKVDNYFAVDDLAISKDFNVKPGVYQNISNNYYWRRVISIGDDYIDLSKTDCDSNSGIPAKGDKICHLGNVTNADRQAAILLSAVNNYAPCVTLYAGINSYSLLNKEYIQYGYDKNTGKAFHKVYGDVYIGDRNATNYIQLKSDILEICAKFISKASGKDLETVISNLSDNLDVIKNQTDKQFIIWFGNDTPTLLNEPALDWNTTDLKDMHIDDWYFIKTNNAAGGLAYRFEKNNGIYSWKNITDADTIAALEKAYTAQDSADKAKDAADSAQEDATKSLNVLDNITSDNILSAAEKPTIRKDWDVIYAEKQLIDAESIIYNVSKTDYDNYFQDLSTYLNNGAAWQSGIPSWISDSSLSTDTVIDGKLFRNKWASFYTSRTNLLNNIYNVLKDFSDSAKSAADSAQEDATNALNTLDSIIADNILSAAEKPSQRKEWNIISAEKSINNQNADNYGISKIDYDNNFQSLATYLNNNVDWSSGIPSWLSDGNISTNTIIDGSTYRSKWQNYYTSRTSLLSAITAKAKSIADDANAKANSKARVFVDTPTPPYSTGDLWVNANYTDTNINILYSNDLLKCKISKDAGQTFDILDWVPANGATSAVLSNLGDAIQACVKSNDFESLLSQKSDTIKAVVYGRDTNGIINTIIAAINLDQSGVKINGNIVEIDADKLNINATTIANAIIATGLQVGVKDAQGNFTAINFEVDTNGNVHAKNMIAEGTIKANLFYTPFKHIQCNANGYLLNPVTDGTNIIPSVGDPANVMILPDAVTWDGLNISALMCPFGMIGEHGETILESIILKSTSGFTYKGSSIVGGGYISSGTQYKGYGLHNFIAVSGRWFIKDEDDANNILE